MFRAYGITSEYGVVVFEHMVHSHRALVLIMIFVADVQIVVESRP